MAKSPAPQFARPPADARAVIAIAPPTPRGLYDDAPPDPAAEDVAARRAAMEAAFRSAGLCRPRGSLR